MRVIIVTGMSGSGKTIALKLFEDMGYYCIDNLPIRLIPEFINIFNEQRVSDKSSYDKASSKNDIALGIDIRNGDELENLSDIFKLLEKSDIQYQILFLDASDDALIKRYKETRRAHPLAKEQRIENGLIKERNSLGFLKDNADYIIDTSNLLTKQLRERLLEIFIAKDTNIMDITILSFGFMYGIPKDLDLLFDVRFLPNPYYDEKLRLKTGEDKEVREYIFSDGKAEEFLYKLKDLLLFLIPDYKKEGKRQLIIGIGCTGGQHRSVGIAHSLLKELGTLDEISIKLENRDTLRNQLRIG